MELFSATFRGRENVIVSKCGYCADHYDIVDSTLAYSSAPIPGSDLTDLQPLTLATKDDVVIRGVTKEQVLDIVKVPLKGFGVFSENAARSIYNQLSAREEPSSSGVEHLVATHGGKVRWVCACALGKDHDSTIDAPNIPTAPIPQTNPETTEVFTDVVKKNSSGEPVITSGKLYDKVFPTPATVEITLTDEENRDVRFYLEMAKSRVEEREYGLIHEERIDSLLAHFPYQSNPMPEPKSYEWFTGEVWMLGAWEKYRFYGPFPRTDSKKYMCEANLEPYSWSEIRNPQPVKGEK